MGYDGQWYDSDKTEVYYLDNGEVIPIDNDTQLMEAYENDLIPKEDMINELGYTEDELL
jgi:hypothetical protein